MVPTMTTINRILTVLVIVLCSGSLYGQHTDGAVWTYTGVQYEVFKDLNVEVAEEFRYNTSVADLYQKNSHFSASYKLTKKIKISGEYRYSIRDGANTNRFGFGASYREGFGDLDISVRSKYQYSTAPDGSEGTAWRNKLSAQYSFNKDWSIFTSGELFYTFSNEIDQWDNYRLETGIDWSPNKHHDLSVSWIYDQQFNVNAPNGMHILSIGYVYSF